MPNYDKEDAKYDTGGDSFGSIFNDFLAGAAGVAGSAAGAGAAGAGGGPSLFRDFIEFLEGNIDGYGGPTDDADLRLLLQTASLQEIGNELDETELVVQQLQSKLGKLRDEIIMITAEVKIAARYLDKLELEESLAELQARKNVVDGYLKKAQKRLLALQTRYKELITQGHDDPIAGGGRRSRSYGYGGDGYRTREPTTSSSSTASSSPSGSSTTTSSSSSSSSRTQSVQSERKNDENSWMNEGFGSSSYGRGRGSGRRQRSREQEATASSRSSASAGNPSSYQSSTTGSSSAYSTGGRPNQGQDSVRRPQTSYGAQGASRDSTSQPSQSSTLPPHRRSAYSFRDQEEDKRRLRELKVDEEFDKLKKELGL